MDQKHFIYIHKFKIVQNINILTLCIVSYLPVKQLYIAMLLL
jgi:hypothetical protein